MCTDRNFVIFLQLLGALRVIVCFQTDELLFACKKYISLLGEPKNMKLDSKTAILQKQ